MATPETPAISARYVLVLVLLATGLSLALYFPTFHNSWAFDDLSYINVSANVLAGKLPLTSALLLAHDEHVVPLFRLLFLVYLKLFGLKVVVWRVMTTLVHAASAVFVALVAWRYTGKARSGIAAAIAYVAPCGFSSMWIWFPSGAAVPIALAALTGASALLAWRDHLRARRIIAGIAVVAALLTWRSFAPMALLPAIIDEVERRREGLRRPIGAFSLFCVAAIVCVVFGGMGLVTVHVESNIVHGVPRAIFLVLVAPFRFFFPGLSIAGADQGLSTALLGSTLGITVGAIIIALLAALWRNGVPRLAVVAGISTIPPFGALLIIGLYRFRSTYFDIYDADRYFYLLLVPIALLAGAIAASVSLSDWPRVARIALMLALTVSLTGEIALHRRAMLRRISAEGYAGHGRRYATLELLVRRLEAAGSFEIPHNGLWFDSIYDRIDTAVLTNVISDSKRLRLGTHIDERRLNPLLDAWAREIGETVPFLRIVDGNLVNTQFPTSVDFSKGPGDALITGFYDWEKPFRWMSARGELYVWLASPDLKLRIAAPVSDLRRRYPAWTSIPVRVTLVDIETAYATPLGVIQITEDGIHDYHFPTSAMTSHGGVGLIVEIKLECDCAWKPSDVYGTADTRDHTVQVYSAGTRFAP